MLVSSTEPMRRIKGSFDKRYTISHQRPLKVMLAPTEFVWNGHRGTGPLISPAWRSEQQWAGSHVWSPLNPDEARGGHMVLECSSEGRVGEVHV